MILKFDRTKILQYVILLAATALLARLFVLTCLMSDYLQNQGSSRTIRKLSLSSYRGMLSDRNGMPLAVSSPVVNVFVFKRMFQPTHDALANLAKVLDTTPEALKSRIAHGSEFVYLARHMAPGVRAKIKALNIPGVHLEQDHRRFYPFGEVSAQIVGFTDIDNNGLEGLEAQFDGPLFGSPGYRYVIKSRTGDIIDYVPEQKLPLPGENITTSIDHRLQSIMYNALAAGMERHKAQSAMGIILDVGTREVLAVANVPSYNPNTRAKTSDFRLRNRPFTDQFEPGSLLKGFSVAHFLEQGHRVDEVIDTNPGSIEIGGYKVRDVRNYGEIDLATALVKSSNVALVKLTLHDNNNEFINFLRRFGFGTNTRSGYPGESAGVVPPLMNNQLVEQASLTYGYGMSTTLAQLANGFATMATGEYKDIKLVRGESTIGTPVLDENVRKVMMKLLTQATETGSGRRARIKGVHVAGKTGTTRKVGPNGYDADRHMALYAGVVPAQNPRFACVIVVDEPTEGGYYGGLVAAPLFKEIMTPVLSLYKIPMEDFNG